MQGVNLRVLQREIIRQAKKPIEARAQAVTNAKLEKIKEQTIEDFNRDEITQEIEQKGDLFGFIGFNADETPTEEVRASLEKNIKIQGGITMSIKGDKIVVSQTIQTPSIDSIAKDASSQGVKKWTDKPWLKIIEEGIPFFSHFLHGSKEKGGSFNSPPSRSGVGLQAKNVVRDASYGPKRYISEILSKLRERITNTRK